MVARSGLPITAALCIRGSAQGGIQPSKVGVRMLQHHPGTHLWVQEGPGQPLTGEASVGGDPPCKVPPRAGQTPVQPALRLEGAPLLPPPSSSSSQEPCPPRGDAAGMPPRSVLGVPPALPAGPYGAPRCPHPPPALAHGAGDRQQPDTQTHTRTDTQAQPDLSINPGAPPCSVRVREAGWRGGSVQMGGCLGRGAHAEGARQAGGGGPCKAGSARGSGEGGWAGHRAREGVIWARVCVSPPPPSPAASPGRDTGYSRAGHPRRPRPRRPRPPPLRCLRARHRRERERQRERSGCTAHASPGPCD